MTIPDQAVLDENFEVETAKPDREISQPRQATRWEFAGGGPEGEETAIILLIAEGVAVKHR